MKTLGNALLVVGFFSAVLLAGCSARTITVVQPVKPPASLYEGKCSGSLSLADRLRGISSTGDLHSYTLDLIEALRACDADRAGIREWGELVR